MDVQTSGTTGAPKQFTVDHAARVERRALTKGPEYARIKSMFCALGLASTAGLAHQDYATHAGISFMAPSGSFDEMVAALNLAKPDAMIASPADLLRYARAAALKHKFSYILSSGTMIAPDVAKEIKDRLLVDGGAAYVSYGASEVGSIALATFDQAIKTPGCVGTAVPGVMVAIEDGRIKVKTPTMISGYTDKAITDKHFRDGWFYPGDKAHLVGDLIVLDGRDG